MNKKIIAIIIGAAIIGLILFILTNNNKPAGTQSRNNQTAKDQEKPKANKVEVFLFHATQRCITCITIGKLAGETVNEYFQPELRNGQIEFREINTDLPENKDLAKKFQASGSSLFINAISNGKDNIIQDTKVWLLVSDKTQFKSYLKDKIDNLLGK